MEPMFVHEMTKKIANNLKGWSVNLNILIRPFAEEVLENAKIIWAGLHCEYVIWNKHIFAMLNCFSDQVSNILTDISCPVQLVPMNYNGFFGNFTAASGCFQLVPKYKLKVKLIKNKHPNIFVWNKSVSRKWEPRSSSMANP